MLLSRDLTTRSQEPLCIKTSLIKEFPSTRDKEPLCIKTSLVKEFPSTPCPWLWGPCILCLPTSNIIRIMGGEE